MGFLRPVKRWAQRRGPVNEEQQFPVERIPVDLDEDSPTSTLDLSPTDIRPIGQRLSTVDEVDDEGSPQRPARRAPSRSSNYESRLPSTRTRTRQPGPEVRQIPQLRPKLHGRPTSNGSGGSGGSGHDFSDMHSLLAVDKRSPQRSPRSQIPRSSPGRPTRPLPEVPKAKVSALPRTSSMSGAPRVDLRASLLMENKQTAERVKALALASLEEEDDDPFVSSEITQSTQLSPRRRASQTTPTKRKRTSKRANRNSKISASNSFRAPKFTTPETEPSFTTIGSSGTPPDAILSESRMEQIERRRNELSQLDEQIRQVGVRLWRLESISQRVRTLPSVPEMHAVDETSPISRNDSFIDLESSKKTESFSQALMSSSRRTESTYRTGSTVMSRNSASPSEYTVASSIDLDDYEEIDTRSSIVPLPLRSNKKRGSYMRASEPTQTCLATKMAYVRPAVVQLKRTSPRQTARPPMPPMPPVPAQHLNTRHKTMPSGYSFITFKSVGKGVTDSEYADSTIAEEEYSDRTSMVSASSQSLVSRRSMPHNFSAFGIRPVTPSTVGTHEDGPTTPNFSLFPTITNKQQQNLHRVPSSRRSSGAYPSFGNQAYALRSITDLDFVPTTPTPLGRRKTPRHASRRRVHVRTESRAIGGSVRAAGNARLMMHDVKRWVSRMPRRLTRAGKQQNRRSTCPVNNNRSSRALVLA